MFLTNRSLILLWCAILFSSFFMLLMVAITREQNGIPDWAVILEVIFFCAMMYIQNRVEKLNPLKTKNESASEPTKESCLGRLLSALIYVIPLFSCIILFVFWRIILKIIDPSELLFYATLKVLIAVRMLFTLRSLRRDASEKFKTSD